MGDILPLELFQGISNIERLKEGTLLLGERHKLEEGPNLKGGTLDPSSYHDTTRGSTGLRDPTLLLGTL